MRYGLGCFLSCQPVVHGAVGMEGELFRLPDGDQCRHGDKTAVTRGKVRSLPEIAEEYGIGQVGQCRSCRGDMRVDGPGSGRFGLSFEFDAGAVLSAIGPTPRSSKTVFTSITAEMAFGHPV